MRKISNVLGIDRGEKYIGLAYVNQPNSNGSSDVIMPIGYILNDGAVFWTIGDILQRYNIKKIVIGYSQKNKQIQEKINSFINGLLMTVSDIEIEKIDEDYSSVEVESTIGVYGKSAEKDTLSAMKILQRWLDNITY